MSSVMCTQDEVDPGTGKAGKELEERLEKRKAEKKDTEERDVYKRQLLICFQRLYSQYFAKLRTSDVKGAPKIEIQQSISFLNEHFAEDISCLLYTSRCV